MDDPKVTSYKEIEVRAILAIVFEVRARDFSRVHVLSDALEVVRAIHGSFDWFIDPVLHDIESLASNSESIEFSIISRMLNSIAHDSAKNSYSMGVGIRGVGLRVFVLAW